MAKISKSDEEWRKLLTDEQFSIARKKGTEMAFTGEYNNHKQSGIYHCVCCDAELFSSTQKYNSGSGWPSFWAPANEQIIDEHKDVSLMMVRTEVTCHNCGAHLGHVFEDGPQPTGLRYCINSASLNFTEEDDS